MNYFDLTYRELQIELKSRGLRANGKREELLQRLEESDNNECVNPDQMNVDDPNEGTTLFHVRTMIGVWYDVRLENDKTIAQLIEIISERTGASLDQISLSTQGGVCLSEECVVGDFGFSEVFLNMTLRLRTRRR